MKKYLALFLLIGLAFLPVLATPVSTTTATVTISGQTITYNVSPTQSPAYYRLAYDNGTKKISTLILAAGTTRTVYTLYCATTYAEVSAFATSNSLTGLPAKPAGGP